MVTFLTSSPTKPLDESCPRPGLDEANGFIDRLREHWRPRSRCLMIAAFPGDHPRNDEMTDFYRRAVENAGLEVACFDLWDDRIPPLTRQELHSYQAIFLAGGHIATELNWFKSIGLPQLLWGYEGLVIGTSAGSMNSAQLVYLWPEEPGESHIPAERLFVPGLGLARSLVLPHYQKIRDTWLDGRHLMEDITVGHSYGRRFYAIPDGSYILVHGGVETLYGASVLVSDGEIVPFTREGESRVVWPEG